MIKYDIFYSPSIAETIINESDTAITTNIQKSLGKVQAGLLIQSKNIKLIFQSINP